MERRHFLAIAGFVAATTAVGAAYDFYRSQDVRLSQPPEPFASEVKLPEPESVIALRVDVPFALIRNAANHAIPAEYRFEGTGPDAADGWIKVGTRYEGTVRRAGEVSVTGTGNTMTVALPIAITGNGGFRGDGARLVGLDKKNFRAGLILKVRVSVVINPDWTPAITVTPDLSGPTVRRSKSYTMPGSIFVAMSKGRCGSSLPPSRKSS